MNKVKVALRVLLAVAIVAGIGVGVVAFQEFQRYEERAVASVIAEQKTEELLKRVVSESKEGELLRSTDKYAVSYSKDTVIEVSSILSDSSYISILNNEDKPILFVGAVWVSEDGTKYQKMFITVNGEIGVAPNEFLDKKIEHTFPENHGRVTVFYINFGKN